jgi:osmotically-inducible protein OsmY
MSQDEELQRAVVAALKWEPRVVSAHIGVAADAGVITLTGHVESFGQKHAAAAAAQRVRGVVAVAEELEVQLPFDMRRSDGEIAAAVANRLDWDSSLSPNSVKISVEQGWVTLTGEVQWYFQKEAAAADVQHLMGVIAVSNQITIKPSEDSPAISDDIMRALHRSWFFDPQTIAVTARGGQVTLAGTVKSWHDREIAEETAWAAPGTFSVKNEITVA